MIKAIIIDDERLARNELKKLLLDFPEIEVIAEAANAAEGVEKIDSLNPDLIFLDLTDPAGPAEALYSAAFYADCRRALRAGGALVLNERW